MIQRKKTVENICRTVNDTIPKYSDLSYRFVIHQPRKIAMCYVPKTGCTFWKQVFFTLQSRDKYDSSPAKIFKNKILVHYKPLQRLRDIAFFGEKYQVISQSTKMMFVRDPYSRLFSAYVDKLVLPEFWTDIGKDTIKQNRRNPDPWALQCGHDVTFQEFLRRVVIKAQQDFAIMGDEHWYPAFKLCHPCVLKYDIIGKQETFSSDRDWILQWLGIPDIRPAEMPWEDVMVDSMEQSIFVAWTFQPKPPCRNISLVMERLWTAFKLQGYLPLNISSPVPWPSDFNEMKAVVRSLRNIAPKHQEFHRRRREALRRAYSKIPTELMIKVREAFKYDFLLFGYNTTPKDLYQNRRLFDHG
ncbi:carbohydrate sulfotransferase 11-like [Liolophura sinensis]|uniref:carbohydrate sulfotransferase 11-like n=1 Tax=Liolophura sinensis TaxID=3198878 RepID=UPI00315894F2